MSFGPAHPSSGPEPGRQRANVGLGPRASVPAQAVVDRPLVGTRLSPAPRLRRTRHPAVVRWADWAGTRTAPRRPLPGGRPRRCRSPGLPSGGRDEPLLNPSRSSRGAESLPTSLRPPWGAIHPHPDAGPENPCGPPRIPSLLGARRTKSPRARLGSRRIRGSGPVTASRSPPPGAAPASGRATAPRSDAPGVC